MLDICLLGRERMAESLRVCVISNSVIPDQMSLWTALAERVRNVTVVAPRSAPLSEGFPVEQADAVSGVDCVRLPSSQFLGRKSPIWTNLHGLRRALTEAQPDIVHVNSELWAVPSLRVALLHMPFVVHGADNVFGEARGTEPMAKRLVARYVLRRSAGYVSWNSMGAQMAADLVGRPIPTLVLPAIVPTVRQPSRHATSTSLRIVVCSRLVPEKGVDSVIDAVAITRAARPLHLDVVGDGPDRQRLEARCRLLEVSSTFHGALEHAQALDVLSSCSILVQPSKSAPDWTEQFGRSVVEGGLLGLAIAASDSGALPEVVGSSGFVFPEGDVAALANWFKSMASSSSDLTRARLSARQHFAATYEAGLLADRLLHYYQDVLRGMRR